MQIKRYIGSSFGTNIYLAWDEDSKKAFLVDPAAPDKDLDSFIKDNALELEYIILTHGHGDHTGGLRYFQQQYPDAKLVAGKKERKSLYERKAPFGPGGIVADIEAEDGMTLEVGNMHLEFIECPGHTPGGISILTGGVLFSGDTLFRGSVGRTDFPGGDWDALLKTLKEKLLVLPEDTLVLPGHMGQTTIAYEKRYNPFV